MAVLERSTIQKMTTSSMMGALLCGVVLFGGVLISYASRLSNATGTQVGKFGPFNLFELSKQSIGNGLYQASVELHFGQVGMYFILWLCVGYLVSVLRKIRFQTCSN